MIGSATPPGAEPEAWEGLLRSTNLSDGTLAEVDGGGPLTRANAGAFVRRVEALRLLEGNRLLAALLDGLERVVPVEKLALFTPEECETLFCGARDISVDMLRSVAEYEGVSEEDDHIAWFWEVLHELRPEERTDFLRFVWARSRTPPTAQQFPMPLKIQAPTGAAHAAPDDFMPEAHTCFFSLSLPRYTSKEVLRRKLVFAISNTPNMDNDFRQRTAEGWGDL